MTNEIPKEIIKAIKGGMNGSFWNNGLKKVLEDFIRILTDKITGDIGMEKDETREGLILKRRAYKDLLELPEIILAEEKENKGEPEENKGIPEDPYDDGLDG